MKIVDLTQSLYLGIKPYAADWYPIFDIKRVMEPHNDPNGTTRTFTQHLIFPHNATHIETSLHFFPNGLTINTLSLDILVGPALIANLSSKEIREPITSDDLIKSIGDIIQPKSRVLIRTDYLDKYWGTEGYWDNPPYLTSDAADWLIQHEVQLVGIDCLTEEPGDKKSPVHSKLLKHNIPIIEYLKNMKSLTSREIFLIALPILVEGVEAATARVIAIDNSSDGLLK